MMRKTFVGLVVTTFIAVAPNPSSAQTPAEMFNNVCAACHSVGEGVKVGPDLEGVTERRSEEWLVSFIGSSQAMINSGDAQAREVFNLFNQVVMPDAPYSDDQIRQLIAYIAEGAPGSQGGSGLPDRPMTEEDVERGRALFQGHERFENGGPTCNSCHHVRNDAVIGGGVLARELTDVFSRMDQGGVGAILGSPPFPVMQAAYEDKPLTPEEQFALIAFLKDADENQAFQQPRDYGMRLVTTGAGGFLGLMVLYGLIWMRRKKRSVNQDIYDRQVRST